MPEKLLFISIPPITFVSSARCYRPSLGSKPVQTPGGGNLARVSTRAGHFLFMSQTAKQLEADFTDPNEAGLSSLPVREGAGAAINWSFAQAAKSRPHPLSFESFLKINHVRHVALPSGWDRSPVRFAPLQKGFAA